MRSAAVLVLLAVLSPSRTPAAPPAAAPGLQPSAVAHAAPPPATTPQRVTIYVDDAYPPYSYAVNGMASGVYPAVLARVFAGMPGYQVDLQPVPWKRGLLLLEQGEGFALAPPYYRPGERPWMDYSAPIMVESVVMYCNEAVASRIGVPRWPDDYYGLRIGINTGFLPGGPAFEAARRGRAEDAYQRAARIVETTVVSQEQGYLGFTRLQGERWTFRADFIRQFNLVLEELRRSGELAQIAERELRR